MEQRKVFGEAWAKRRAVKERKRMATGTIECPRCSHENEYDTDNDTLLCEKCDELIFISEPEEVDG